jgi:hypothetical protein
MRPGIPVFLFVLQKCQPQFNCTKYTKLFLKGIWDLAILGKSTFWIRPISANHLPPFLGWEECGDRFLKLTFRGLKTPVSHFDWIKPSQNSLAAVNSLCSSREILSLK